MPSEKELTSILSSLQSEVGGFIGASVVDTDSGMTLATVSNRADFDLSVASAYNSEMVKLKTKTIASLNLNSELEDMLLTLSDQIHLIKMLPGGSFLYLAAERASTNLAIVRTAVARECAGLA